MGLGDAGGAFKWANAIPPADVLGWLKIEHDGKQVTLCPKCGATSGVVLLSNGIRVVS